MSIQHVLWKMGSSVRWLWEILHPSCRSSVFAIHRQGSEKVCSVNSWLGLGDVGLGSRVLAEQAWGSEFRSPSTGSTSVISELKRAEAGGFPAPWPSSLTNQWALVQWETLFFFTILDVYGGELWSKHLVSAYGFHMYVRTEHLYQTVCAHTWTHTTLCLSISLSLLLLKTVDSLLVVRTQNFCVVLH